MSRSKLWTWVPNSKDDQWSHSLAVVKLRASQKDRGARCWIFPTSRLNSSRVTVRSIPFFVRACSRQCLKFLVLPPSTVATPPLSRSVPLRNRCSFGRFPWLISQALSVTYMAGERRLYLERNCRLPESPAHSRRRNREGPASSKGLNSQRGFGPAVEPRRKSRPRSTSLHGSSPCKCQRLSTLRWDRLPPSRPSTKSGARAGGRRLSDRRLHRWLAGTSASAPSSHGAADLLGLNRAHICVRNPMFLSN